MSPREERGTPEKCVEIKWREKDEPREKAEERDMQEVEWGFVQDSTSPFFLEMKETFAAFSHSS